MFEWREGGGRVRLGDICLYVGGELGVVNRIGFVGVEVVS